MKTVLKEYRFALFMFAGIALGCIAGLVWPNARALEPLGTVYLNAMFCTAVPLVFVSIASAIAGMRSARRAGRLMGVTVASFCVTCAVAALLMYALVRLFPVTARSELAAEPGETAAFSAGDMLVHFLTQPDLPELFSRKAMLPLIVAAIVFGFGVRISGDAGKPAAELLHSLSQCLLSVVRILSYYAPIGFLGFFAATVSGFGAGILADYGRSILLYWAACVLYMGVFYPVYARLGGKDAVRRMFRFLARPALTALATCSSTATIPANLDAAKKAGIPEDVADLTIPMGATMNMDGSAMSAVLKVAFLFSMFGMEFTAGRAIPAIAVAVLSSVAMSGIPGGGGAGELVLCTLFFPDQLAIAYPVAIAIGNLIDAPATMVNAAGDYVSCFPIARFARGRNS